MSDSLWLNDAGAILGDTTGTFKPYYDSVCCCDKDNPIDCIYERQVAVGVPTADLIDNTGATSYTLAELCTEANKFVNNPTNTEYWWTFDTSWGSGESIGPVRQTSDYFTSTQTSWDGYVTSTAELATKIKPFTRAVSNIDFDVLTGINFTAFSGSATGAATEAAAIAAAIAATSADSYSLPMRTRASVSTNGATFSASFFAASFEVLSTLKIGTNRPRTIGAYIPTGSWYLANGYNAHGQGVDQDVFSLFIGAVKGVGDSNAISDPGYYINWPSLGTTTAWEQNESKMQNGGIIVVDFEFECA